jgi:UTP--glucose-1-phosphate uridylyltransferase
MPKPVTKAVFPVAGLGTRFLPATKAMPKEMLPIVDKPLIQYAVEEAAQAGIRDMIFITGRNKRAIEDHFDHATDLERELEADQKHDLLKALREATPKNINCIYIRQGEPLGLGHAVLCAQPVVRDDAFAVILADELLQPTERGGANATAQLCSAFAAQADRVGGVIAVNDIPGAAIQRYGTIAFDDYAEHAQTKLFKLNGIVEKPQPELAPSHYGAIGRYVFSHTIFDFLKRTGRGSGGEIQLTDAIAALLKVQDVFALETVGRRFDCGSKLGYLQATVAIAMEHPEVADEFGAFLRTWKQC